MKSIATNEKAVNFAWLLAEGEPNREQIVLTGFANTVRERIEGCNECRGVGVGCPAWADTGLS